jgi:hypothetical protein
MSGKLPFKNKYVAVMQTHNHLESVSVHSCLGHSVRSSLAPKQQNMEKQRSTLSFCGSHCSTERRKEIPEREGFTEFEPFPPLFSSVTAGGAELLSCPED